MYQQEHSESADKVQHLQNCLYESIDKKNPFKAFWNQVEIWITTKIKSFVHCIIVHISCKRHQNLSTYFLVILQTDRQTNSYNQLHNLPGEDYKCIGMKALCEVRCE